MIELETLAYFYLKTDEVYGSFHSCDSKKFKRCVNDCLNVANSRSEVPKLLRVNDSSGNPSQEIVQE